MAVCAFSGPPLTLSIRCLSSSAAPKKSWIQLRIQSLPFHIAAHLSVYLAPNLLRLKSRVTYLDGNLFNLQFRGRGDIPDSSEVGQKEILGKNLRNSRPGCRLHSPEWGVGDGCFCSRGPHVSRVCFKIVMWDWERGEMEGGGLVLH